MPEFIDDSIDFTVYMKATDAKTKVKPVSAFVQDAKDRSLYMIKVRHLSSRSTPTSPLVVPQRPLSWVGARR